MTKDNPVPVLVDPELELNVVGTVYDELTDRPKEQILDMLCRTPPDFLGQPILREGWACLQSLVHERKRVSNLSFETSMERRGHPLKDVGEARFLRKVTVLSDFDHISLDESMSHLIELYARREVVRLARIAAESARDFTNETFMDSVKELMARSDELQAGIMGVHHTPTLANRIAQIFADRDGKFADPRVDRIAKTGISELDELFRLGVGLHLVGARMHTGKSLLGAQIALEAIRLEETVLYVNLDMPDAQYTKRMASAMSGIPGWKLDSGAYDHESLRRLSNTIGSGLFLESLPASTPWSRIEGMIRSHVRRFGTRVIVLDYFTQIKKPSSGRQSSDASSWAELSQAIKGVAMELGLCIVLLAQLNREGDGVEAEARHLRETGALEQDATTILLLWKTTQGDRKIKLAKDQNGPNAGRVLDLELDRDTLRLRAIQHMTDAPSPKEEPAGFKGRYQKPRGATT